MLWKINCSPVLEYDIDDVSMIMKKVCVLKDCVKRFKIVSSI